MITLGPVHHIGHVVEALDPAISVWARLGFAPTVRELMPTQGVEAVMLEGPGGRVELITPTEPDSGVRRFLDARGAGMHHIAFGVPDLTAALAQLADGGAELIDAAPRAGLGGHMVAFIHPREFQGVLVELVEDHG